MARSLLRALDTLLQEGGPLLRTVVWVGARVLRLREGQGLVVRGEDESGAVREDLGEVGSAVPAAGKGADAVVAAEVCESGEALGDGAMDAMLEWAGSTCVSVLER